MSSDDIMNESLEFDIPKNPPAVIKVVGVGGGGGNAVNHMHMSGIRGVDFVVCNTDAQALLSSSVPHKIQLGQSLTEGMGAGANPEVGKEAAEETEAELRNVLSDSTKMVFITAGMGGGTGTGAAPVIARIAKDMGILTVGIVTTPFMFEGSVRLKQAEQGIEEMRKHVDSLIIINNNKLREVYGNLGFKAGFAKADEVLAIGARGIAEVITYNYSINIDLRDAKTVLTNSGTAIMGSGRASGENRAKEAIVKALDSPLLNDNHIRGAKNVLLLIVSGKEEITIDEIGEINDHIQNEAGGSANIIMGVGEDENLDSDVAVTIVATGFSRERQETVHARNPRKIVHTLSEDQPVSKEIFEKPLRNDGDEEAENNIQPDLFSYSPPPRRTMPKEEPLQAAVEEKTIHDDLNQDQEEESGKEIYFSLEDEDEDDFLNLDEMQSVAETEESTPEAIEDTEPAEINLEEEDIRMEMDFQLDEDDNTQEEYTQPDELNLRGEAAEDANIRYSLDVEEESAPSFEHAQEVEEPQAEAEEEIIRYSLDDLRALEDNLQGKKAEAEKKESEMPSSQAKEAKEEPFVVEKRMEPDPKPSPEANNDPFDRPISEGMKQRAEERRSQLRAFNYRFKNAPHQVDELSSVPAYQRQGLKLENGRPSSDEKLSRSSIEEDENGPSLRGNNSFLHDNVD